MQGEEFKAFHSKGAIALAKSTQRAGWVAKIAPTLESKTYNWKNSINIGLNAVEMALLMALMLGDISRLPNPARPTEDGFTHFPVTGKKKTLYGKMGEKGYTTWLRAMAREETSDAHVVVVGIAPIFRVQMATFIAEELRLSRAFGGLSCADIRDFVCSIYCEPLNKVRGGNS